MKHTEGPWTAKRRGGNWCVAYNFDYGDSRPVTVWLFDAIIGEADARLIAQAPAMLAALEATVQQLREYEVTLDQEFGIRTDDVRTTSAAEEQAVAVIAKAKGEGD